MDWLSSGVMFAWYASVLVVIGAVGAVRVIVLADASDADGWAASALRLARMTLPFVVIALLARLWLQTWQAFGSDQPLTIQHAVVIMTETPWGDGWMWQMAAGLLAWIIVARATPVQWQILLLAGLVLGGTVGKTGHAAGDVVRMVPIAHGVHVVAAGLWLATLGVILGLTRRSATAPALARVIDRFSPTAIVAVTALALSGLYAAWEHVGSVAGLSSPYGYVLIAKVATFAAAGLCGLYNWRVVRRSIATHPAGVSHLRSVATLELVCGIVALVLTSLLTSMPMPTHP